MAFDALGNLWVANSGGQNLAGFSPAQQAAGGSVAPHIVISSTRGPLGIPVGPFQTDGSLWVIGGAGALNRRTLVNHAIRRHLK